MLKARIHSQRRQHSSGTIHRPGNSQSRQADSQKLLAGLGSYSSRADWLDSDWPMANRSGFDWSMGSICRLSDQPHSRELEEWWKLTEDWFEKKTETGWGLKETWGQAPPVLKK